MIPRFVVFTEINNADYVIDGYGFKYVNLSEDETTSIMQDATQYQVVKEEIENYSHEDMGNYTYVTEVASYELDNLKSVSEKIWLRSVGVGDIIVVDGKFFGVVFFTGFTDYREEEKYGFIPIEHLNDRKGLSKYSSPEISILTPKGSDISQATMHFSGEDTERTSRSWDVNFYLRNKQ